MYFYSVNTSSSLNHVDNTESNDSLSPSFPIVHYGLFPVFAQSWWV